MEIMTSTRQNTYPTTAEGNGGVVRLNRRGEFVTSDFVLQAAMDGRLFVANAGTLTAPMTFAGAGGVIDGTKPMLYVGAPAGTTIIPVSIQVYIEVYGTNAQFEIMACTGTGGVQVGGTKITPTCLRTDAPNPSNALIYGTANSGCTYPTTNVGEFWRNGQQFAITKTTAKVDSSIYDPNRFEWKLSDALTAPVLVGASQLFIVTGGQALTGFCIFTYVEIPTVSII